ncbi:hypothetical protein Cfor_06776 [Coptotermes formosanus]|uniref:Uncharacterized protein n=1 Tax=Coptotermes formosanus TaxID=36987 RepID=A0A6L2PL37_COPFO|nr:hypothetical protein Cfor_06776 [Coptotermes formosanus]
MNWSCGLGSQQRLHSTSGLLCLHRLTNLCRPQQLDHNESSKLRRLAAVKRKELGALLSKPVNHCNMSNAVNLLKSAVNIRVRPQNRNSVFLKKNCKIKKKSKE